MQYLGLTDLLSRWIYSRQGLHKLMRKHDFPKPMFTINRGRTKVWYGPDVQVFEDSHPELTSEAAKRRKVRSYAIGNFEKRKRGATG